MRAGGSIGGECVAGSSADRGDGGPSSFHGIGPGAGANENPTFEAIGFGLEQIRLEDGLEVFHFEPWARKGNLGGALRLGG